MKSHTRSLLLAIGLSCITSIAVADGGVSKEASAYFRNAVELISDANNANYQDAYYQFKLAYEKSNKSWKVLGNLGLCAFKLERDKEAIAYYDLYLKQGGTKIAAQERSYIERDLMFMKGNIATVVITSDVKEFQVVDSRQGSKAPAQVYRTKNGRLELGLRAGSHTLQASAGDLEAAWTTTFTPGQSTKHEFDFKPKKPGAGPVPGGEGNKPPPPPPKKSGGSPLKTVGFISLGVGVAAMVGGGVTGLMSSSKENSANDQCRPAAGGGKECPESARADFDSADSLASTTNILLIGGGVLVAAGATLLLTAPSSREEPAAKRSLHVTPMVGQGNYGIAAIGRF